VFAPDAPPEEDPSQNIEQKPDEADFRGHLHIVVVRPPGFLVRGALELGVAVGEVVQADSGNGRILVAASPKNRIYSVDVSGKQIWEEFGTGEAGYDEKERIGYMPEERGLYQDVQLERCLVYLATLKGLSNAEARRRVDALLERFELAAHKQKKVKELSKGMAQIIQLIVTIIHDPELVILDEPFTGLDPVNNDTALDKDSDGLTNIAELNAGTDPRDTDSDENLYFCSADPEAGQAWLEDQQAYGIDVHSLCCDPGFVDPENGNFNLQEDAAALKLGFQPLPLDRMLD